MFKQLKVGQSTMLKAAPRFWLLVLLVLASLACSLGRLGGAPPRKGVHIQRILPTFTPTVVAGSPQDAVAAETPGLQELSTETTPLRPAVTAIAVAQDPPQPVNSSTPPGDTSVRFVFMPMVSSEYVNSTATPTPDSLPNPVLASVPTEVVDPLPSPPPPLPSLTPESVTPPSPEPNPVPDAGGWSFTGIQAAYDQEEEGLIMHGDMINNTGAAQAIIYLTGTLFDGQSQVTTSVEDTAIYWPLPIVPSGGQVPFELITYDIQGVTDFNLSVISEPSSDTPRQDFEFSDLKPSTKGHYYCVRGKLWNQGNPLQDNLSILIVLYDDQDNIINFGTFEDSSPQDVQGDKALHFEICTDSYDHQIARHELRAVGF